MGYLLTEPVAIVAVLVGLWGTGGSDDFSMTHFEVARGEMARGEMARERIDDGENARQTDREVDGKRE